MYSADIHNLSDLVPKVRMLLKIHLHIQHIFIYITNISLASEEYSF